MFIWTSIKEFGELLRDSPVVRYATFGVLIAVLVGSFFLFRGCKSPTEKRIESRDPVIVEQEQAANDAVNAAVNANIAAANAQDAVNKVRHDKQANVNIAIANRNRCLAFPDSAECKQ